MTWKRLAVKLLMISLTLVALAAAVGADWVEYP